jgi:hypothetical protein
LKRTRMSPRSRNNDAFHGATTLERERERERERQNEKCYLDASLKMYLFLAYDT